MTLCVFVCVSGKGLAATSTGMLEAVLALAMVIPHHTTAVTPHLTCTVHVLIDHITSSPPLSLFVCVCFSICLCVGLSAVCRGCNDAIFSSLCSCALHGNGYVW